MDMRMPVSMTTAVKHIFSIANKLALIDKTRRMFNFLEENKVARTAFEAIKVAGTTKCKQGKVV